MHEIEEKLKSILEFAGLDLPKYAVVAPIVWTEKPELLIEVRAAGIPQAGDPCFPGGHIEPGETPSEAALRELKEELGINIGQDRILGQLPTVHTRLGSRTDVFVCVLTEKEAQSARPSPDEVSEMLRVPLDFFLASPYAEEYSVGDHIIWGMTAGAIRHLCRTLSKISVMEYDAVIFDMDGVIFDSERAAFQCWLEIADRYGVTERNGVDDFKKVYWNCIGTTRERTIEIFNEAYGNGPGECSLDFERLHDEVWKLYTERYAEGLPLKPGVVELLTLLKPENACGISKKIALATSTRSSAARRWLELARIDQYFDAIIGGDMIEHSKPAPDIFIKACEVLKTAPARSVVIEDSYNGIRAAAAGGLIPIMVPDLLPSTDEMIEKSVSVQKSLEDVCGFLAAPDGRP